MTTLKSPIDLSNDYTNEIMNIFFQEELRVRKDPARSKTSRIYHMRTKYTADDLEGYCQAVECILKTDKKVLLINFPNFAHRRLQGAFFAGEKTMYKTRGLTVDYIIVYDRLVENSHEVHEALSALLMSGVVLISKNV